MAPTEPLRRYGQVFDQVADAYDAARPGYPPALVDRAVEWGGLTPGSPVLEVGCGTGKLTELLVARGLRVDAVDPGPNMIAAAKRRIGAADAATFHVGRFEDLALPLDAFDAVFSATAFHWIEPAVGWVKVASHLRPGGMLALLVYTGLRDDDSDAAERLFLDNLETHAPELAAEWRPPRDLETILSGAHERRGNASAVWDWVMTDGKHELAVPEAAGLFDDVEVATEAAAIEHTADEALAQLRTTSLYFRIPAARRTAFEADYRRAVERLGGTFRFSVVTVLMTARRV
jgi:SAM-dependent methyltransferase